MSSLQQESSAEEEPSPGKDVVPEQIHEASKEEEDALEMDKELLPDQENQQEEEEADQDEKEDGVDGTNEES